MEQSFRSFLCLSPRSEPSSLPVTKCSTPLPHRQTTKTKIDLSLSRRSRKTAKPSILSNLKSRMCKPKTHVSPEEVSRVIKNYVIPMFEAKSLTSARSSKILGLSPQNRASTRQLEAPAGTVYSDLKVITELAKELEVTKASAEILQAKYADSLAAVQAVTLELDMLRNKAHLTEKKLQISQFQQELQQQDYKKLQTRIEAYELRSKDYKNLYTQAEEAQRKLKEALNEMSANQSHLHSQNFKLGNANEVLRIENRILGERLAGLLRSFSVNGQLKLQEELSLKLKQYQHYATHAHSNCAGLEETVRRLQADNTQLKCDFDEIVGTYTDTRNDSSKLVASLRRRITSYESIVQRTTEENSQQASKLLLQDKLFKQLTLEHSKLLQKLKQHKTKLWQDDGLEQLCRNCNKTYLETDNFNWSCRVHPSDFGGDLWWCCGKADIHALGCLLRKHVCKDDDQEKAEAMMNDQRLGAKICSVWPM